MDLVIFEKNMPFVLSEILTSCLILGDNGLLSFQNDYSRYFKRLFLSLEVYNFCENLNLRPYSEVVKSGYYLRN